MEWTRESGSFRDPSGFVFSHDGVTYRQINAAFGAQYRQLIDTGLYDELAQSGLLVNHEEVDFRLPAAPPAFAVLRPQQIPFISYPYEWCFSQLRAAALLTLDVQRRAIERGMVLRDASAYNVQFAAGRPVFIDTLSFGPYVEGEPWIAYRQFCQHFLAPLAMMVHVDAELGKLMRIHIDGIPLDMAARLLPLKTRLRPGLLTHVHLHAKSLISGPAQHSGSSPQWGPRRMGKTGMLGLVDSLRRTVEQLTWTPPATLWSTYTEHSNYTATAHNHKQRLVGEWLTQAARSSQCGTVWDLGANVGIYSRIAAEHASLVVSFDLDQVAVEYHFRSCQSRHETKILPLVQDFANPSPPTGWHHRERQSLVQRGPTDAALALALVHHLAIGNNVPLSSIAAFFRDVTRHLIIEFVPREDSQVQRMLALREDVFSEYSKSAFESAFERYFDVVQAATIEDTLRTLYLMIGK